MSDILLVEEINDVEKFRSLREIWNTLLQKSSDNNIFLTWEWLFTWWQHHSVGKKLRILLIKDMNRIIAIVPLMQSKERKGIFQLDFIENICAQNCDYSGIILTEKKHECLTCLLEHLVNMLKDNNMIVRMWHIPENSSFLGILRQQYPSFTDSIHMTERPISSCPYIKLPATWEEYYRALHHGTQKSLRKKINKLQKNHVVGFRKYTGSPDLRAQLQTLFRLHQKRWQNKGITSKFTRANEQDFYFDVSEYFYQNGWLNMSFLTVDGSPVSATWGFDYKNEYYSMTSAFNLDYSTYSVGAIHLMELIKDSIQNGRSKYDFLKGNESYKFRWAHHTVNNIQITITKRGMGRRLWIGLLEKLPKIGLMRPTRLWHGISNALRREKRK